MWIVVVGWTNEPWDAEIYQTDNWKIVLWDYFEPEEELKEFKQLPEEDIEGRYCNWDSFFIIKEV